MREKGERAASTCSARRKRSTTSSYVEALARERGLPLITRIQADQVPAELSTRVPINFARQHKLLAARRDEDGVVRVAVEQPARPVAARRPARAVRQALRARSPRRADVIEDAINRVYERTRRERARRADTDDDVEELQDIID